jgi:UDPglucose--hexose-1-phosphate uridylyltransferase
LHVARILKKESLNITNIVFMGMGEPLLNLENVLKAIEIITDEEKIKLAEVLKNALSSIKRTMNNPPYNFYIHTSPCDGKDYRRYHWHIEILPHTSTWAGFELETGIEISMIQPEEAAIALRDNLK